MFRRICSRLSWLCSVKRPTITRSVLLALGMSVAMLLYLSVWVSNSNFHSTTKSTPELAVKCHDGEGSSETSTNKHKTNARLKLDNKVLVLVENQFSKRGQEIIAILESNRMKYKMELAGKSLPYLTHQDKGKYGVVVFESFEAYLLMDKWNRQLIDKYCRDYSVGIVAFTQGTKQSYVNAQVKDFPLYVHTNLALKDYKINPESDVLRIIRAADTLTGDLPGADWTVFISNHTTYVPLTYASMKTSASVTPMSASDGSTIQYVTAIQDQGLFDGIQRVIFGNSFHLWIHRPLFMDSLSFLSHGKFSVSLDRYMLIDIDDIFVAQEGTRMIPADVQALIESQDRLSEMVPGFHYNLGFSGGHYRHGSPAENAGDEALIEYAHKFWWFPHTWKHIQPHKVNTSAALEKEMNKNLKFAQDNHIPVDYNYAIAPHHSGVFPVHDPLYTAWKNVWDVKVTSTEEYPHLRPARHRRGYVYNGIKVLPRQTCGLFTHTIFLDKYPNGKSRLDDSIRGGELFQTFLYNPFNIYMTHLSNYGNDRLAIYTFENVIKFLQCWTNFRISTVPPVQLADLYFKQYPDEIDPLWKNPCDDKRHLAIWSADKQCDRLPKFLVIGPQKTGSTALYAFLSMHPSIVSNNNSPTTFEEVQFFNGKNYHKGVDWYMSFFPPAHNKSTLLFEKSANYFDSDLSPVRAHALLPHAKIIVIIIDPAKRAYSWYQHMVAHEDKTALQYSFYEVITATEDSPHALRDLRSRCLTPGFYAQHIESWLDYYPNKLMLILDGAQLKSDPIHVMNRVQTFLGVEPFVDFHEKIRFSPRKGFYCQVVNSTTKCLGRGKGRVYPDMDGQSAEYLNIIYRKHNIALSKLLTRLNVHVPEWLEEKLITEA